MKNIKNKRIWISWEKQRRTIELAQHFECLLFIIEHHGLARFPLSILNTIKVLKSEKPEILIVQNPSMILAAIGCLYKKLYRKVLVVDRHSNFMINKNYNSFAYKIMFKALNGFTLKNANLTIVTNRYIADSVKRFGGKAFILQDKIPNLKKSSMLQLKGKLNILFIASHKPDEPLEDMIEAMNILDDNIYLYITGNYNKEKKIRLNSPQNVVFTGYLPEEQFNNMVYAVDIVIALTKIDYCLLCGCYEAVAAGKPLITTNTKTLKEYFPAAVFVNNTYKEIAKGIEKIYKNINEQQRNIILLRNEINKSWQKQILLLEEMLK